MTPWKKIGICLSAALCMLCLPGCWDYQRINYRSSLIGLGIEPSEQNPSMLKFTLQFPQFETKQSGSGSPGSGQGPSSTTSAFENFSVEATSFGEAVAQVQTLTDKTIFVGNLESVVISTKLTGEQFDNVVSELMRSPYTDKVAFLEGTSGSAEQVLQASGDVAPADKIERFLSISVRQKGYAVRSHLWQFWRDSTSVGISPSIGIADISDNKIQVHGMCIFRQTQPTLMLDEEDTLGYNFLVGNVDGMALKVADGQGGGVVVHDIKASSRLSANVRGGKATVHATLHVKCTLDQEPSFGHKTVDPLVMKRYQTMVEEKVRSLCLSALKKTQEAEVDPFGFGRMLVLRHPAWKDALAKQWLSMFRTAQPDIEVHASIESKGSLM